MEGFYACIIIWIPFTAEGMYHSFFGQVILKGLACVLTAKIAVKDNPFCYLLSFRQAFFIGFYSQIGSHGSSIGITNDLAAA